MKKINAMEKKFTEKCDKKVSVNNKMSQHLIYIKKNENES